jgi:endonuclease G
MKQNAPTNILLLLLLCLPLFLFSQTVIQTDIFTVNYSEKLEQPIWLEYEIICNDGDSKRSGMRFVKYKDVHTSDDLDYKYNEWDKGHLAPAATFDCSLEMLKKTFTYLNCALQHNKLNRGPWAVLEKHERQLAKTYNIRVKIDLVFDEESIVLETGATVPSCFIKTIYFNNEKLVVEFPNKDVAGIDWREFIVK